MRTARFCDSGGYIPPIHYPPIPYLPDTLLPTDALPPEGTWDQRYPNFLIPYPQKEHETRDTLPPRKGNGTRDTLPPRKVIVI